MKLIMHEDAPVIHVGDAPVETNEDDGRNEAPTIHVGDQPA